MDNQQELINKICDLSRKIGHAEGLLQRKSEMLDKCDRRVREMREDKNRVCELIESKIKEIHNGKIDDGGLLTEEYRQVVSYNDGIIEGLSITLDLLVVGVDNNED